MCKKGPSVVLAYIRNWHPHLDSQIFKFLLGCVHNYVNSSNDNQFLIQFLLVLLITTMMMMVMVMMRVMMMMMLIAFNKV